MEITNGQLVTAGTTDDTEITLADNVQRPMLPTYYIEVVSGTVQFAADEAITADHYAWPAGSKIVMTVKGALHFKATATTDTFVVTV